MRASQRTGKPGPPGWLISAIGSSVEGRQTGFVTACSHASKAADFLRGLALAEPADAAVLSCPLPRQPNRGSATSHMPVCGRVKASKAHAVNRCTTSIRRRASALRSSTRTARRRRPAQAAEVGSCGLVGTDQHQRGQQPGHSLQGAPRIATRWARLPRQRLKGSGWSSVEISRILTRKGPGLQSQRRPNHGSPE